MKCPVCEKQIENTIQKCPNCGFEDLRTEFINENELERWQTYVVYPCRFAYQIAILQIKKLEEKLQKESSAIKGVRLMEPQSLQELMQKNKNEYNLNAPIIHPNYAICKDSFTSCDVYNIKCELEGTTCKISFLVKKTFDVYGETGTSNPVVHWRLKDEDGIIVKSDRWIAEQMRLGDIKKHTLILKNIEPGKYSIDFIGFK